ncbi:hypothetical protein HDU86_000837, partial [Geranomyces michiganensis]
MGINPKTVAPEMAHAHAQAHPPPHRPTRHPSASLSPSAQHDLESGNHHHHNNNNPRRLSTGSTASADSRASEVHRDGEIGIDKEHKTKIKVLGRVGFAAKAVI